MCGWVGGLGAAGRQVGQGGQAGRGGRCGRAAAGAGAPRGEDRQSPTSVIVPSRRPVLAVAKRTAWVDQRPNCSRAAACPPESLVTQCGKPA